VGKIYEGADGSGGPGGGGEKREEEGKKRGRGEASHVAFTKRFRSSRILPPHPVPCAAKNVDLWHRVNKTCRRLLRKCNFF